MAPLHQDPPNQVSILRTRIRKTKQPDLELIGLLYDSIEKDAPALAARTVLMEHWIEIGFVDEAKEAAQGLLRLDPSNTKAKSYINSLQADDHDSPSVDHNTVKSSRTRKPRNTRVLPPIKTEEERAALETELSESYRKLRVRAQMAYRETRLVQEQQVQAGMPAPPPDNRLQDLKALTKGQLSAVVSVKAPISARAVSRAMQANFETALDTAVEDLSDVVRWKRATTGASEADRDSLRTVLAQRVRVLTAALPDTPEQLQQYPATALMHVEHELLERTYVNDETLYKAPISEIPRANFWVTEDGYAWDMEELNAGITSNRGVMRNPLSREMFSATDIRAIIRHPLGRGLAALDTEQRNLFQGVRQQTIDKLDELAAVLLADNSMDQLSSRKAIDGFLAYQAVLPREEQRSLDELRVPARDSHTGQAFDCTIGEAVRDAQANKICLHKTGDLIGQAAGYLRRGR
jgi:hypothetical protein